MKQTPSMIVAATLVAGTAAFSTPSQLSVPSKSKSLAARPLIGSNANNDAHVVPYRAQHPLSSSTSRTAATRRLGRKSSSSLGSSLKDTFEPEAANNQTSGAQPQPHAFLGDTTTTPAASTQQQLQQVLSSPELLDPAAILEATIGINDDTGEVTTGALIDDAASVTPVTVTEIPLVAGAAAVLDESMEVTGDNEIADENGIIKESALAGGAGAEAMSVTDVTSPAGRTSKTAAKSKEEDLELTLQAILNHMEQISIGSGDVEEDVDHEGCVSEVLVIDSSGVVEDVEDVDHALIEPPVINNSNRQVAEQSKVKTSILDNTPTISKILKYTIPAIGIWLCSPVLSMIDTAAVGLLSGTAQQAALNPAVSVTDYGALVVAFMYTATTNLIAAAIQEDKDNELESGQPKTRTTLVTSLKLALLVGSVFSVVLGFSGKHLLKLLIGNDALDPTVFSAALQYVRIRSLGMPAMLVIGTAQSACLGMQDVKSPLYVLLAAAIINFFGDVMLVPMAGSKVFGGAAGAAWATVASQYAAVLFFGRWLTTSPSDGNSDEKKRMNLFSWMRRKDNEGKNVHGDDASSSDGVVNITQSIMELTGTSKAGQSRRKEFRKFLSSSKLSRKVRLASARYEALNTQDAPPMTKDSTNSAKENVIRPVVQDKKKRKHPITRGFLADGDGKLTLRKYLSFSKANFNRAKAKEFLPFVVPVTTTSLGRISGYIAMSHVASSTLGTFDMAAHQIIFSIFCCLTPFVDALSQVAQSFVPAVFEAKGETQERALALRKTVGNFRKVGFGFGAMLVGFVLNIPLISRYFTTDSLVLGSVNGAIPGVAFFLFLHGLMCAGEGALLGQKDLTFLRNMYAIFFFTVPAYMLRLKHRALTGVQTVGIGTMWTAFSTYNLIRTSVWHLRLAQLQRRTDAGVAAVEE